MSPPTDTPQRAAMPRLPSFRTPVRGHAFAPRRPETPEPTPGEPAELMLEPANPADPQAVAVWAGEGAERRRIGYLDRGVAARVAPRLRDGLVLSARVDGWTGEPEGRWQRPVVFLRVETLPPQLTGSADPAAGAHGRRRGVWGRPPGVARRTLGPARDRSGQPPSSSPSPESSSSSGSSSSSSAWDS